VPLRQWLFILFVTIIFPLFWGVRAETLTGRVVGVSDGDTLTLLAEGNRQVRVRLAEIDTPESRQPYGSRAKQALSDLAFGKTARVEVQDTDRYAHRGPGVRGRHRRERRDGAPGRGLGLSPVRQGSKPVRLGSGGAKGQARPLEPAGGRTPAAVGVAARPPRRFRDHTAAPPDGGRSASSERRTGLHLRDQADLRSDGELRRGPFLSGPMRLEPSGQRRRRHSVRESVPLGGEKLRGPVHGRPRA
jgi:hypothetical protein